jgi:hypothetical protein
MPPGSVKPAVYRLTIDLSTRRVSEPDKYVFPLHTIIDSMSTDLPALWPGRPTAVGHAGDISRAEGPGSAIR